MPEPVWVLRSVAAAAFVAAALLLGGWFARKRLPGLPSACGVLGVGLGWLVGCWLLDLLPRWPPPEDRDRLLLVLLPAAVVAELAGAFGGRFVRLAWLARLVVAALAARVLLHGSVFIADHPGLPREWSAQKTGLVLAALAAALALVWAALHSLAGRPGGRSVPLALAVVCTGSAVTVLLSGYMQAGLFGLALAGALAGAAVAALVLPGPVDGRGVVGVGVVGLFGLLVAGRFFGELTTLNAGLLFAAALLCWAAQVRPLRRLGPRLGAGAALLLALAPVGLALTLAQQKFVAQSGPPTAPGEATAEDYADFMK
jgi:hypothetical protein